MDIIEEQMIIGAIQNIARCRIVLDLILNSNESDIDKFCNGLICTSDMS